MEATAKPLNLSAEGFQLGPTDEPMLPHPPLPRGITWEQVGTDEYHKAIAKDNRLARQYWAYYRQRPFSFLRECVRITNKDGQRVNLDITCPLYRRAQEWFAKNWLHQHYTTGRVRLVILKARQWGATTLACGLNCHQLVFNQHDLILEVADNKFGSQGILDMLRGMVNDLPEWLQPTLDRDSKNQLRLDGEFAANIGMGRFSKSAIIVDTAMNVRAGRKWTLKGYHGTEVAYWGENAGEVLDGCLAAVAKRGYSNVILESTAYGWGGTFFDMVRHAQLGKGAFRLVFIPWFAIDEYRLKPGDPALLETSGQVTDPMVLQVLIDKKRYAEADLDADEIALIEGCAKDRFGPVKAEQILWRRWMIDTDCRGDIQKFCQEYPATAEEAFLVTGEPTFSPSALVHQSVNSVKPPAWTGEMVVTKAADETPEQVEFREAHFGRVKVWDKPEDGHDYIVAGDFSEGDELIAGIESQGAEDVAPTKGKKTTRKGALPDRTAFFVLDRMTKKQVASAVGRFVPDEADEMFWALCQWYNGAMMVPEVNSAFGTSAVQFAIDKGYHRIYQRKVYDSVLACDVYKYGWITSRESRGIMFSTARGTLRQKRCIIQSQNTVDELMSMINARLPSGKMKEQAKSGSKDDDAIACVIALQVDRELGEAHAELEAAKRLLDPSHPDYAIWQTMLDESREKPEGFVISQYTRA